MTPRADGRARPVRGGEAVSGASGSVRGMAGSVVVAEVSALPLSIDALVQAVTEPRVGGVALFVGVVRDHNEGHAVTGLDYEAHPAAGARLRACAAAAARDHDVVGVAVSHRTGALAVGDLALVVAVGAEHRDAALVACRSLVEAVKADVPIWKHEHRADGESFWVGS